VLNTEDVEITASAQALNNGVTVTFGANTGHTLDDYWEFTATTENPLLLEDESGNDLVFVGNNGRVGIGTTSPAAPLHIKGTDENVLELDAASGQASIIWKVNNTHTWEERADANKWQLYNYGAAQWVLNAVSGSAGVGYVGINTQTPGFPLHLYGATTQEARIQSTDSGVYSRLQLKSHAAGYGQVLFGDSETDSAGYLMYTHSSDLMTMGSTGHMLLDSGDNVNLDAHSSVFNFKRQGSEMFRLTCGASSPITFQPKQDAYDMAFNQYDGTEVMRITDNARVGIATTAPGAYLDVAADNITALFGSDDAAAGTRTNSTNKIARIGLAHYTNAEEPATLLVPVSTEYDNYINYGGGSSYLNATTIHRWYTAANNITTNGTERMRLQSDGELVIGATVGNSNVDVKLSVAGHVIIDAGGTDNALGFDNFETVLEQSGSAIFKARTWDGSGYYVPILWTGTAATQNLQLHGGVMSLSGTSVGINEADPAYNLDVVGTTQLSGNSVITGTLGVTDVATLAGIDMGRSVDNILISSNGVSTLDTDLVSADYVGTHYAPVAITGTIGGSITDNQIAFGATTANSIEGSANLTYYANDIKLGTADTNQNIYLEVSASGAGYTAAGVKLLTYNGANRPGGVYSYNHPNTAGWYSGPLYGTSFKWGIAYKSSLTDTDGSLETTAEYANAIITVEPDGDVGIGTTTPARTLDVAGTVGVDDYIYHNSDSDTYMLYGTNTWRLVVGDETALYALKDSSALIGINTTSPQTYSDAFTVKGPSTNSNPFGIINSDATVKGGMRTDKTDNYLSFHTVSESDLRFYYNNAEANTALIIKGSGATAGNVGIGTTDPASLLHVSGGSIKVDGATSSIDVGATGGYGSTIRADSHQPLDIRGNSGYGGSIMFTRNAGAYSFRAGMLTNTSRMDIANNDGSGGGEIISFTSGKDVGIGTTGPAYKLDVVGTTQLSGAATVTGTFAVEPSNATNIITQAMKNDISSDTALSNSYNRYFAQAVSGDGAGNVITRLTAPPAPSVGDEYFIVASTYHGPQPADESAQVTITADSGDTINKTAGAIEIAFTASTTSLTTPNYRTAHLICVESFEGAATWAMTISDYGPTS
jgi:hypothetical protein